MLLFYPFCLAFSGFYFNFTQFVTIHKHGTIVLRCKVAKDFANMQEKEQKISPIKQRILQFADTLNISKREFYTKIGVSRGTLESKTGITEDVLAKFIAVFPDVSIDWLMQGKGQMRKVSSEVATPSDENTSYTIHAVLANNEKLIRENERLLIRVEELEDRLGINNSPPHDIDVQLTDN